MNIDLSELSKDETKFTKFLKQRLSDSETPSNMKWFIDGKGGFKCEFENGGYARIKFFDCIKKIFNSKNIEIPGRESSLSYIDITVMPSGVKGYNFIVDLKQEVWGFAKSIPLQNHTKNIENIVSKAKNIGCDMNMIGSWSTHYVGKM